jgi:hypothetical protein
MKPRDTSAAFRLEQEHGLDIGFSSRCCIVLSARHLNGVEVQRI